VDRGVRWFELCDPMGSVVSSSFWMWTLLTHRPWHNSKRRYVSRKYQSFRACKSLTATNQSPTGVQIEIISSLKHENIVRYLGHGAYDGKLCMAMQFYGTSLERIIEQRRAQLDVASGMQITSSSATSRCLCLRARAHVCAYAFVSGLHRASSLVWRTQSSYQTGGVRVFCFDHLTYPFLPHLFLSLTTLITLHSHHSHSHHSSLSSSSLSSFSLSSFSSLSWHLLIPFVGG
jgi:hypothetical protein